MAFTKENIIEAILQAGIAKRKATKIVETLLETIKSTLENGEDVLISRFGKFCVKEKKKRRGRNPQTGNDLILNARRVVTFKGSGQLNERLNKKK